MSKKYALGIDYGTLSARGALIDMATGEEVCSLVYPYPHGCIDRALPDTELRLKPNWCLFDPGDYRDALEYLLSNVWRQAGVKPEQVLTIGLDTTACTALPVDEDMQPLCWQTQWKQEPHAWPKLWKHLSAQAEADRITEVARQRGETFLEGCGNATSAQFYFSKLLEIYRQAPQVYRAMDRFVNVGDWLVWLMTDRYVTSVCTAGYKCFHTPQGFPSGEFFEAVELGFGGVVEEKVRMEVVPNTCCAGTLTPLMAQKTGLTERTVVAPALIDAHVAVPAVGLTQAGGLMMAMGTSLCHVILSREKHFVPGIFGTVLDGVLDGMYAMEAGQAAVGDIYDWFVRNAAGGDIQKLAREGDIPPIEVVTRQALAMRPGETGLMALDWWTGNRSILNDANLSGVLLGLTMTTTPAQIYRALVEGTAYGARVIVENFRSHGVAVERVVACGGLSRKSRLVMQVFADVLGMDIEVSNIKETTALGSAMYAMVALGAQKGGFGTLEEAVRTLIRPAKEVYHPRREDAQVYDKLYAVYKQLHDFLGTEHPHWMHTLKQLQQS